MTFPHTSTATHPLRGSLSELPAAEVLLQAAQNGFSGIVHLRFSSESLNTRLVMYEGQLCGVTNDFLPPWSASLVPHPVAGHVYEDHRMRSVTVSELLQKLKISGVLDTATIERALQRRSLMALLPVIQQRDGRFLLSKRDTLNEAVTPGVSLAAVLDEAQGRMGGALAGFHPDQTMERGEHVGDRSPALSTLDIGTVEVFSALAQGLSLQEVAKRSFLLWDELLGTVHRLEGLGLLRRSLPDALQSAAYAPQTGGTQTSAAQTRATHSKRRRLKVGDLAPGFNLPDAQGKTVSLEQFRGQNVLIRFNRQAGCPICNPRNRDFIRLYPTFQAANTQVIGIFGSSVQALGEGVGKQHPPYPILSDPSDSVYALYGVERSILGVLNPKNWAAVKEGMEVRDAFEMTANGIDGEATRMPAELLVGPDGVIKHVYYSAYAADFLPLDTLLGDWLRIVDTGR